MPYSHQIWWEESPTRACFTAGVKGHVGVSQGQPEVKFLKNVLWPPNLVEKTPDQSVVHWWGQRPCRGQLGSTELKLLRNVIWLLGVIRGQPEGNCLEMRRAIKCSQCYKALCSCRCSSYIWYFLYILSDYKALLLYHDETLQTRQTR